MARTEQTHWWYVATRTLLARLLAPRLLPSRSQRFLDAGCGTGATGAWLANHGSVVALDIEPEALRIYDELHPGATLVTGGVERIDLPDDSVDGALCVTVLYHRGVDDPSRAVRELSRVVRPGGWVCVMEPGVRRLRRPHDRVTHTGRRFSRRDLRRIVESAGLDVERATGAYSFLVPPALAKALVDRRRTSSDLEDGGGWLRRPLLGLAAFERAVITRWSVPFGLSVIVVATKPKGAEPSV
jgi:SAM-dependent methyltransferase